MDEKANNDTLRRSIQDTFQPMRVSIRYIEDTDTQRVCRSVGQAFKRGSPTSTSVKCDESTGVTNNCWGTCTSKDIVTTAIANQLKDQVIPSMTQTFASWLSTRPMNDRLPVSGVCGAEGGVPLPDDMDGYFDGYSYDTLFFVTLRPTTSGVLGWATACRVESGYGRPIMGHLNLSPVSFTYSQSILLGVAYHESVHALGFSSSFYKQFIDENGSIRKNTYRQVSRSFVDSTGSSKSVSYTELTTPSLQEKAKEYFNCSSITGIPLEDSGGGGTAGSHFEKTYFLNELMVGSVGWNNPTDGFTNEFTLSFLQDTGWYKVNTQNVAPATWGKNMGCNFLSNRCEDWNTGIPGYFCTDNSYPTCTFDHRGKGGCSLYTYSANLGYYEHIKNYPTKGGGDSLMDYCPIVMRYTYTSGKTGDCQLTSNGGGDSAIYGETFSTNSACFDSNMMDSRYGPQPSISSRCFGYSCENATLHLLIKHATGTTSIDCPADGSIATINPNVPGFTGYVKCPKLGYKTLCPRLTCFNISEDNSAVCSGHGRCTGTDTCACTSGYSGSKCEKAPTTCYSVLSTNSQVCSGHGTCEATDTCVCNATYTGSKCETPKCFNVSAKDSSVCSGHGNCTAPNVCSCHKNFTGSQCQTEIITCYAIDSTKPQVCSGNGVCKANDNCVCNKNYTGNECNTPKCFNISARDESVCSRNGNCTAPDTCVCRNGYSGKNCTVPPAVKCFSIDRSDALVCSGHGICVSTDNCSCNANYTGMQCETAKCFNISANQSNVCSGYGSCIAPDTCSCFSNYTGLHCEIPPVFCFSISSQNKEVCHGNGVCNSTDHCICDSDYTGKECDVPVCFGLGANDNSSCSGRGNCTKPNVCVCHHNFTGIACQIAPNDMFQCYSINRTDFTVCSGHGTCEYTDMCNCDSDYTGYACDIPLCFGVNATDEDVCSGNGSCSAPDQCNCTVGYYGDRCQHFTCYDIDHEDDEVCNGQGSCQSLDTCECSDDFDGPICSIPKCFGVSANQTMVCSGNGQCIGPNNCTCNSKYIGLNCDEKICAVKATVLSKKQLTVHRHESISIQGSVAAVQCPTNITVSMSWEWIDGPSSIAGRPSNNELLFDAFSFPFGAGVYKYRLIAQSAQVKSVVNYDEFEIQVVVSALNAVITSTNIKVSIAGTIQINASQSNDPDREDTKASFTWKCLVQGTEDSCSSSIDTHLSSQNGPILTVPSDLLTPGKFVYTVTYSKGSRSATRSAVVEVLAMVPPTVKFVNYPPSLIRRTNVTINASVSGVSDSYQWTINGNKLEAPSNSITIPSSILQPGTKYLVRLEHSNKGGVGYDEVTFTINSPPKKGTIEISPAEGDMLSTEFTFSAKNWTDAENNSSLLYQWSVTDPLSKQQIFALSKTSNILQVPCLPAGTNSAHQLLVTLTVFDSLMESTLLTQTMTVKPMTSSDPETQSVQVNSMLQVAKTISGVSDMPQFVIIVSTLSSMIKSYFATRSNARAIHTTDTTYFSFASQITDLISQTIKTLGSSADQSFINEMASCTESALDSVMSSSVSKQEMQQKTAKILLDLLDVVSGKKDTLSIDLNTATSMVSTTSNILSNNQKILPQVNSLVQRIANLHCVTMNTDIPVKLSNTKFTTISSIVNSGSALTLSDENDWSATFSTDSALKISQLDSTGVMAQIIIWKDRESNPNVYQPFIDQRKSQSFSQMMTVSFRSKAGSAIRASGLSDQEAISLRFQLGVDPTNFTTILYYQNEFGQPFLKEENAQIQIVGDGVLEVKVKHNTNFVVELSPFTNSTKKYSAGEVATGPALSLAIPIGVSLVAIILFIIFSLVVLCVFCCVRRVREGRKKRDINATTTVIQVELADAPASTQREQIETTDYVMVVPDFEKSIHNETEGNELIESTKIDVTS